MTRGLTAMAGRWLTELQGVTIDFWGAAPSFTYGLRRPGPSSPDVPRATVPHQGAVCMHRRTPAWIEHGCSFETRLEGRGNYFRFVRILDA